MKLHRLRQVTVDDLWPLSERYQLRTAYSDFKLNTSESYFVIRAIFRMMWRPMIPVYIVGLLLQFIPLLQIKLNSNIMRNVDDLSNYSMLMIVADIARVVVVQLLDNQQSVARQFIQKEMARAENAIDIELFRLPLQRMGLVKDSDGFIETRMTQGTGKLVGKIAYLEQQPWIMNDTLRANILFGREYEEEYYWKVLDACALTDDLEMWPSGDMTVIGENGMNISGGQRARLALARTVYSKADIYFLDDPLSAVDAIVKRHILDNIILSTGLLGDKLRFVTTNADNILPLCNQIASVEDGHVSVKVQTPLAHTAFKSKGATASKVEDIHKASIEQITASDVKQKEGHSSTGKDPKSNAEPLKQWSRWSNTKYAIRICGLTMVLTIVITKLFEKISQALLDMYETDCAFDPLYKGFNEVEKNVTDDRDRNKSLVENGAQMIRLFGVEPHFTNNYIKSAESKARLDLVKYAYSNLHGLVSSATKTVLHSLLLYVYIVMSKFGLYTIRAGDVAEFRQNCSSMGWKVSTISALPLKTRELLAKINEFRNLAEREPEAPYVVDSCRPSAQWPPNGKLEFRDFSMRYGADLGYALKNINLTINPGEKIGIVGRTGAGKSSLAKVLFRLVHENTSGSILIDGQDISEFGVGDYRPRLGMIPQESTMLDGSIRHNLDPLNQFDIEQMWASLIKCNMAKSLSSCSISMDDDDDIKFDSNSEEAHKRKQWKKAGWFKRVLLFIMKKMPRSMDASEFIIYRGLDRYANSCYGGISSGQEQLFGLCRVIMRRRKIIVLDEATANVDLETDKMVQELIRKEFSDCTVLTIAH
ncbi:Multidrug resistance-associated protein 1, partial [Coemansia sp. RSA 2675]